LCPEFAGDVQGIDAGGLPPAWLVANPVQRTAVAAAQRHDEFITDLAAERPRLRKAQVVRIGRRAAADQARLPGDKPQMLLVAVALGLGDGFATADTTSSKLCDFSLSAVSHAALLPARESAQETLAKNDPVLWAQSLYERGDDRTTPNRCLAVVILRHAKPTVLFHRLRNFEAHCC
jgi:hypothetical protein